MSDVPPPPGAQPPPPPPGPPSNTQPSFGTPSSTPPPPPPPPGVMSPPPGYVAYGAAPTPMGKVNRVKGLSTAVVILVAISGATALLSGFLQFGAVDQAQQFLDGDLSEDEFTEGILGYSALQGISGLVTIAAGILVMIWMYRMSSNLRTFGTRTTWHPLFAIFGWFLPPGVLYIIPFLMLRELWKKSAAAPGTPQADQGGSGENPALWGWLVLYGILPLVLIVMQAASFAGTFGSTSVEDSAETIADLGAIGFAGAAVSALAAAAWIVFVRQLTKRHTTLTGEN